MGLQKAHAAITQVLVLHPDAGIALVCVSAPQLSLTKPGGSVPKGVACSGGLNPGLLSAVAMSHDTEIQTRQDVQRKHLDPINDGLTAIVPQASIQA